MPQSFGRGFAVCTMTCVAPYAQLIIASTLRTGLALLLTSPTIFGLSARRGAPASLWVPPSFQLGARRSSLKLTFVLCPFHLAEFGFGWLILHLPGVSCPSPAERCSAFCSGGAKTLGLGVLWLCHLFCPSKVRQMPSEGNACGVGGWLRVGATQCFWFLERFAPDFRSLGIPVKDDANLDISSYETLAQGFLLVLLLRTVSGGRLRVKLPALSDNVGAESVINRLYTSKQPLALFVQRLAMWACAHAVSLACSHIAGEKNVEADALSRWDESCPTPHTFGDGVRVRISLPSFWQVQLQPQLLPADTFLQWRLPQQSGPLMKRKCRSSQPLAIGCFALLRGQAGPLCSSGPRGRANSVQL